MMQFLKNVVEGIIIALILLVLVFICILISWAFVFSLIYLMYTIAGIHGALWGGIGFLILFIYFFISSEEKE